MAHAPAQCSPCTALATTRGGDDDEAQQAGGEPPQLYQQARRALGCVCKAGPGGIVHHKRKAYQCSRAGCTGRVFFGLAQALSKEDYGDFAAAFSGAFLALRKQNMVHSVKGLDAAFLGRVGALVRHSKCKAGCTCACHACDTLCGRHQLVAEACEAAETVPLDGETGFLKTFFLLGGDSFTFLLDRQGAAAPPQLVALARVVEGARTFLGHKPGDPPLPAAFGAFERLANPATFFEGVQPVTAQFAPLLSTHAFARAKISDLQVRGQRFACELVVAIPSAGAPTAGEAAPTWAAMVAQDPNPQDPKRFCFAARYGPAEATERYGQSYENRVVGEMGYFPFLCYVRARTLYMMKHSFGELLAMDAQHTDRVKFAQDCAALLKSGCTECKGTDWVKSLRKLALAPPPPPAAAAAPSASAQDTRLQELQRHMCTLEPGTMLFTGIVDSSLSAHVRKNASENAKVAKDYVVLAFHDSVQELIMQIDALEGGFQRAEAKELEAKLQECMRAIQAQAAQESGEGDASSSTSSSRPANELTAELRELVNRAKVVRDTEFAPVSRGDLPDALRSVLDRLCMDADGPGAWTRTRTQPDAEPGPGPSEPARESTNRAGKRTRGEAA